MGNAPDCHNGSGRRYCKVVIGSGASGPGGAVPVVCEFISRAGWLVDITRSGVSGATNRKIVKYDMPVNETGGLVVANKVVNGAALNT